MIDYYGDKADYIHLKFGRMQKAYNFTAEFRTKYPNFCEEYEKYWDDKPCRFKHPIQIAQYVNLFSIPVHFYYNFTDTPSKGIEDVFAYLLNEYTGISEELDGSFRMDYDKSLDGESGVRQVYAVLRRVERPSVNDVLTA